MHILCVFVSEVGEVPENTEGAGSLRRGPVEPGVGPAAPWPCRPLKPELALDLGRKQSGLEA